MSSAHPGEVAFDVTIVAYLALRGASSFGADDKYGFLRESTLSGVYSGRDNDYEMTWASTVWAKPQSGEPWHYQR